MVVVYISPHGKRFMTLAAVRNYILHFCKPEKNVKRKINVLANSEPSSKRCKLEPELQSPSDIRSEDQHQHQDIINQDLQLSPKVKEKRKQMALRSPFRNLYKKTLMKNQKLSPIV